MGKGKDNELRKRPTSVIVRRTQSTTVDPEVAAYIKKLTENLKNSTGAPQVTDFDKFKTLIARALVSLDDLDLIKNLYDKAFLNYLSKRQSNGKQITHIQFGGVPVPSNEVEIANEYFKNNPLAREFSKKKFNEYTSHSLFCTRDLTGGYTLLTPGEVIGEGSFGKVKMLYDVNGEQYVIKRILVENNISPDQKREIEILHAKGDLTGAYRKKLADPKTKSTKNREFTSDTKLVVIQKYVPGDELLLLLNERPPLTTTQRNDIASFLIEAVQDLHKQGIVHGDIHAGNIKVQFDQNRKVIGAKLIDFGLSSTVEPNTKHSNILLSDFPMYINGCNNGAQDFHDMIASVQHAVDDQNPNAIIEWPQSLDVYTLGRTLIEQLRIFEDAGFSRLAARDPNQRLSLSEAKAIIDARRSKATLANEQRPEYTAKPTPESLSIGHYTFVEPQKPKPTDTYSKTR